MDRSSISRILLIIGLFFLGWTLFKGCGKEKSHQAQVYESFEVAPLPSTISPSGPCILETANFQAEVSPVAGGLLSYQLKGSKYTEEGKPIDVAYRLTLDANKQQTRPDYAPLRTFFRNDPAAETQVPGDLVAFTAEKKDNACILKHTTPEVVEIQRIVKVGAKPYELEVETTVKNLSNQPRKHAFSTGVFALQFKDQEGGIFSRPSPNGLFKAACSFENGKIERKDKGELKDWFIHSNNVNFVSLSSMYIGQAIVPLDDGARCSILAQERGQPGVDPNQTLFRAYIAYPTRELAPGSSATYKQLAFIGPKDRHVLAAAAGSNHHLEQLLDFQSIGFLAGVITPIAKLLLWFLSFVKGIVGSWGIAIILLTISVRLLLLPLTLPQIKSSIAMRKLKPELDALQKKFENDPQAKMLATSQLYKKNGINPLAGCLPALLQMPVWFALYGALQTAIEIYHEKFLIWNDLSSPDPRFIFPIVLGATMYMQQRITPMQMDPAQQKIFLYFMPAMFTVFMLFLPAGLGVYMLTNSLLGILQTLLVERYMARVTPAEIKVSPATSVASTLSQETSNNR